MGNQVTAQSLVLDFCFIIDINRRNDPGIKLDRRRTADTGKAAILKHADQQLLGSFIEVTNIINQQRPARRALEETGMRDNTIIIVTSDHGEFMTARKAKAPRARGASSNPPKVSMGANYRRTRMNPGFPEMASYAFVTYLYWYRNTLHAQRQTDPIEEKHKCF
mgnify:CR=1 FL=1